MYQPAVMCVKGSLHVRISVEYIKKEKNRFPSQPIYLVILFVHATNACTKTKIFPITVICLLVSRCMQVRFHRLDWI